jgi:hypothetical protein
LTTGAAAATSGALVLSLRASTSFCVSGSVGALLAAEPPSVKLRVTSRTFEPRLSI